MNAKECYDSVMQARNDKAQQVKVIVFEGIRKAVQSNQLYYSYSGDITEQLTDELREAGFKISVGQQYNETWTSISWDLA